MLEKRTLKEAYHRQRQVAEANVYDVNVKMNLYIAIPRKASQLRSLH